MKSTKNIRWGIAGLGDIARRFAADLTRLADNAVLQAVASRSAERAKDFAADFEGSNPASRVSWYGSYEELAADSNVDVVYVATIHPFHKKLAQLFLNAGKHVLVEKPGCTNARDWLELCELAAQKSLFLGEAMKSMYFPAYIQMKEYITANRLSIRSIRAAFGTANEPNNAEHIWNEKLAGGATLDVGVYPLWLYVDLCRFAGIAPGKAHTRIDNLHPELGIDETASYSFIGEIKAELASSIVSDMPRDAVITALDPEGREVQFIIEEKWWNPCHIRIIRKDCEHCIKHEKRGDGLVYEIEAVSSAIKAGDTDSFAAPRAISAQVIGLAEDILRDNGYRHLVD